MRVLRTAAGLILVAIGVATSLLGAAGLMIGDHRGADGSFVAELAPVYTDGYAITVPDVAGTVARHGAARVLDELRLFGDAELTLTVRADRPVLVALVPTAAADGYLIGVGRTEIEAVGFATGAQPVQTRHVAGTQPRFEMPQTAPWTLLGPDRPLDLNLPRGERMALVIMRTDRDPEFTASLAAGLRVPSWSVATALLLFVGTVCLISGATVLVRRRRHTGPDDADSPGEDWTAQLARGDSAPGSHAESPYVDTAT